MRATNRNSIFLFSSIILLGILAACSIAPGAQSPTTQVVKETVLVIITSTPEPISATPTTIPQPTDASPTNTPTATPTAASTATLTPAPLPSLTPLALLNVPIEGGDPNHAFFALLVFPNYQPAATVSLWFRVYAHDPVTSTVDGQNIDTVEFTITNSKNVEVYDRIERTAGYCAFGGGEPNCNVFNFASHNYTWPAPFNIKITSGTYNLHIIATDKDQNDMFGDARFRIQVP